MLGRAMATVSLQQLGKRFPDGTWGARDVGLDIDDAAFVVLLGPSGCGKTTTLRLIAGLEEASTGTILIDGRDVTRLPPRKRHVSMVFQSYAVWPHMTVFDNIAFPLRLRRMPKHDIRTAVQDAAALTKIDEYLARYPGQLSGGQQQRVALARALVVQPDVFLMDEPFSNLDAALRAEMRTELKSIHQQTRATTLFVTHDQAEAMGMADRIVIMHDGRIVQDGSPEQVYFEPASLFVARFIGTPPMNVFRVDVESEGDAIRLRHAAFRVPLSPAQRETLAGCGADHVMLGLRPEDIRVVDAESAALHAPAHVIEPQGSHQVVSVAVDDQLVKIVMPPLPPVAIDDALHLAFNAERLHLFDPQSGRRLV